MALNIHLDAHLKREFGSSKYTVSGSVATLPTTTALSHDSLVRLLEVAVATSHKVAFGSSGITITPR